MLKTEAFCALINYHLVSPCHDLNLLLNRIKVSRATFSNLHLSGIFFFTYLVFVFPSDLLKQAYISLSCYINICARL